MEETWLCDSLERMLDGMAAQVAAAAQEAANSPVRDSVLDADFLLSVARTLLKGGAAPPLLPQQSRVDAALKAIAQLELNDCYDLFGRPRAVDFSQFKVRGHYQNSPRLARYFQAVMWLGRIDLRVAGGPFQDSACAPEQKADPRETGTAVVLTQLLQRSGDFQRWLEFDHVIQLFVGWTDSMTFAQMAQVMASANVQSVADLAQSDRLAQLQDAIEQGQYGIQNIKSDYFVAPLGPERLRLPRSFTVFGQKFVPDSWALSKQVYDDILWVENGVTNEICRRLPSGLDVAFSVLGNNQVVPDLLARITDRTEAAHPLRDGLFYQHNLAAARAVMDRQGPPGWTSSLYVDWLGVLRELSTPILDPAYPQAMRSHTWAMKSLNTQLASWTSLRHDTMLYAKPSYTPVGVCQYPAVFVEPHPTFWARLEQMISRAADAIGSLHAAGSISIPQRMANLPQQFWTFMPADLGQLQARQVEHLRRFASTVGRLARLAQGQLAGVERTADDELFLCDLIQRGGALGSGGPYQYNGWYPRLFYRNLQNEAWFDFQLRAFDQNAGADKWDAIIADIHTDLPSVGPCASPGSVLHQAIGNVNLLFIAVDLGTRRTVFAGPTLSHYEFETVGPPRRLADDEWKAALRGQAPAGLEFRPKWREVRRPVDWDFWTPEWFPNPSFAPPPPPWTKGYLVPGN